MADVNPLTGLPLETWQQLVTGPPGTWNAFDQGPRRTVVDTRPGAVLPPWILRLDIPIGGGAFVTAFSDDGRPGGSYSPSIQELPDLVATAPRLPAAAAGGVSWPTFLLLALAVFAVAWTRRG